MNPAAMLDAAASPLGIAIDPRTATSGARTMHGEVDLNALFPTEPVMAMAPAAQFGTAPRQFYFLAKSPAIGTYYFLAPQDPAPPGAAAVPVPETGPEFGLGG